MDNLMTTAVGLISSETRQVETAAQNVANLATPGYKRLITFADALSQTESSAQTAAARPSTRDVATDFMPGRMVHTGNPLDLALSSGGFFAVSAPDGTAYLRGGSFRLDADGRLVTRQGWALQSSGGGDVVVSSQNWRVLADGTVLDDGQPVAVIGTASFANPNQLSRTNDGLYRANGARPAELIDPRVMQGYLEASNVSNADEMIRMMAAMRRVESGQKLVHAYDDMMGTVLQRLGDM
ncbi:flagellar hook-basal body protein [Burkholderia ambifaria]|uniref:flagellar hook-basal body protein n=2 Tax=Burkholderia ambifaria TaxID=152480 RepID=UPI00158BA794|nr:flagellar hook basal-body protein [Burkholderia ambifaria]